MRRRFFLKAFPLSTLLVARAVGAEEEALAVVGDVDTVVLEDQLRVVVVTGGAERFEVVQGPPPRVILRHAIYLPVEDVRHLSRGPARSYRIFTPLEGGFQTVVEFDASPGATIEARLVGRPQRLVIDVGGPTAIPRVPPTSEELRRLEADARAEMERFQARAADERLGLRIHTIVIDPGHGGHDPGAVGAKGTKEKDITLAISQRLARRLEAAGFGRVVLTRTDDYYLNLSDRTAVANQYGADLFVSIHCNASENRKAQGSETFFCSEQASSQEAARVAAFENSFAEPEELARQESLVDIEWVLFRLHRRLIWKDAQRIATDLQDGLRAVTQIKSRGTESAGFFVLKKARMPSVLVETAFISNPDEEQLLAKEAIQEQIASTLAARLTAYAA